MKRLRRQLARRGDALALLFDRADGLDLVGYATDAQLDAVVDATVALQRDEADSAAFDALAAVVGEIEAREYAGEKVAPPKFRISLRTVPRRKERKPVVQPEPSPLPDNVIPITGKTAYEAWLEGGSRRPAGTTTGREWVSQERRRYEPLTKGLEDMQW